MLTIKQHQNWRWLREMMLWDLHESFNSVSWGSESKSSGMTELIKVHVKAMNVELHEGLVWMVYSVHEKQPRQQAHLHIVLLMEFCAEIHKILLICSMSFMRFCSSFRHITLLASLEGKRGTFELRVVPCERGLELLRGTRRTRANLLNTWNYAIPE